MFSINKQETREFRINIAVLIAGIGLVIGLVIYSHGGAGWFTATAWSQVSILKWIAIVITLGLALVLQYYLLMLLRHSFVKYLVFGLIPAIWLFINGLTAIQRLFESAAEAKLLTGWIPITDLIGWLLGAVYIPVLVGGGIAVAIIESGSLLLSQSCQIAGMVLDVTSTSLSDYVTGVLKFLGAFLDLLGNSFLQEVAMENLRNRSFFDFSLTGIFSLPQWLYSAGYSFTCIIS